MQNRTVAFAHSPPNHRQQNTFLQNGRQFLNDTNNWLLSRDAYAKTDSVIFEEIQNQLADLGRPSQISSGLERLLAVRISLFLCFMVLMRLNADISDPREKRVVFVAGGHQMHQRTVDSCSAFGESVFGVSRVSGPRCWFIGCQYVPERFNGSKRVGARHGFACFGCHQSEHSGDCVHDHFGLATRLSGSKSICSTCFCSFIAWHDERVRSLHLFWLLL